MAIKNIKIFFSFFCFWFLLLGLTGSLTSGFHLIDDHQLITMQANLVNSHYNLFDFFYATMRVHPERFIPFYYVHRVLEFLAFKSNIFSWSLYTGFLAAITSTFFYCFVRKINFSRFESTIFVVSLLTGYQSIIWSELGRAETIGMVLLSISLYLMAFTVKEACRKCSILFIISVILMSLCKESFILLVPAILFWKLWLDKEEQNISWLKTIQLNKFNLLILGFVTFVELAYIKFFIGVNIYYAGLDISNPIACLHNFASISSLRIALMSIILFAVCFTIAFYHSFNRNNKIDFDMKTILYVFITFILITVPQVILYTKSGFFLRYLVPAFMGYSVLLVYSLYFLRKTEVKNFLKKIIQLIVILICITSIGTSILMALKYAKSGQNISSALSLIESKTDKNSKMVIVSNPILEFEETYALNIYLKHLIERKNVYLMPILNKESTDERLNNHLLKLFYRDQNKYMVSSLKDIKDNKAVIVFVQDEKAFIRVSKDWFNPSSYNRNSLGVITVYLKND